MTQYTKLAHKVCTALKSSASCVVSAKTLVCNVFGITNSDFSLAHSADTVTLNWHTRFLQVLKSSASCVVSAKTLVCNVFGITNSDFSLAHSDDTVADF